MIDEINEWEHQKWKHFHVISMTDLFFHLHQKHEHVKSFEMKFDLIKNTSQFLIFYVHI